MFLFNSGLCKCNYTYGPLIGRIFLGLIFFLAGIDKLFSFSQNVAYVESLGFAYPSQLIALALVIEIVGSISLFLGWYTRVGSWLLIVFLIALSLLFRFMGQAEEIVSLRDTMQGVSMAGGLILLSSFGPGILSVDHAQSGCKIDHSEEKPRKAKPKKKRSSKK